MTLGEQTFAIEGATVDSAADPGAGTTTDAALIQEHTLRPGALARRLELVFSSPVTFRAASGEPVLFPLPELVFGSLLARWNAFCDIHLPEETRRYVAECMGVSRFRLRTQAVTLPLGGREIEQHGFTGQCRFVFLRGDRYWRGLVWSLAAYSFYAGVGQSTALGLGRTRLDSRPAVAVGDS